MSTFKHLKDSTQVPITELVVHNNMYHQRDGRGPEGLTHRFGRRLASDEAPHIEKVQLTTEWISLPKGTLTKVGLITLRNIYHFPEMQPTEDQKVQLAKRTIEVSLRCPAQNDLLVPPGESQLITPSDPMCSNIYIRAGADTVDCWVYLSPP